MRRRDLVIAVALLISISCVCDGAAPLLQAVRVPDGGIDPQVQTDGHARVHLIYFKGDPRHGDIFYVRSDDGCASFTTPIRVNSVPHSAIVIGTIRGPHLALGRNDRPHVAWMGSDQPASMFYARLNDAGDAFETQRNVIGKHPGLDGGGSVAADREGNVYVAWHAPEHVDSPGEENRQVWLARSQDDGQTFEPEIATIPRKTGVCGCCGLNITAAEGGRVYIVFRSATAKVNRDIHVLESKDFGKTFQITSSDPWNIGKCVMSTAALARRQHDVLAAWETQGRIRLIALNDAAVAAKPVWVANGNQDQKHPSVAANARGEYLVVWAEGTGWEKGGEVIWQVFDADDRPVQQQTSRLAGLPPWSVPAALAKSDGSFCIIY